MKLLETALKYHKAGFHVVPVNKDKQPMTKWSQYQESQNENQVKYEFTKNNVWGIALITGVNGFEVIDLDLKYDITGDLLSRFVKHTDLYGIALNELVVQTTVNGGYHFMYRCEEISGNEKLAQRPATDKELKNYNDEVKRKNEELKLAQSKIGNNPTPQERKLLIRKPIKQKEKNEKLPQVLIETRGKYGYVIVHPTKGYEVDVGNIFDLPIIDAHQRQQIFESARSFNEIEDIKRISKIDKVSRNESELITDKKTCWDDYNEKGDIIQLLEVHGWKIHSEVGERTYFTRPAKDKGVSADFHSGHNKFKVMSTSTEFEENVGYSKYAVYTTLEHNGDFKEAAKSLYKNGYGDRITKDDFLEVPPQAVLQNIKDEITKKEQPKDIKDIIDSLNQFSLKDPLPANAAILTLHINDKKHKIGGLAMSGVITGSKGAGKSLLLSLLMASGLDDGNLKLFYRLKLNGKKILDFDTEQPDYFYKLNRHRLYAMANKHKDSPQYISYNLSEYDRKKRFSIIDYLVRNTKDLGLVVIDGVVDLVRNYNDLDEAQIFADVFTTKWTRASGALILGVLHEAKTTGEARGHLGTELDNKASFVLNIKKQKENNTYHVTSIKERFAPYPEIQFERNESSFPVIGDYQLDAYYTESIYKRILNKEDALSNIPDAQLEEMAERHGFNHQNFIEPVDSPNSNEMMLSERKKIPDEEVPF